MTDSKRLERMEKMLRSIDKRLAQLQQTFPPSYPLDLKSNADKCSFSFSKRPGVFQRCLLLDGHAQRGLPDHVLGDNLSAEGS